MVDLASYANVNGERCVDIPEYRLELPCFEEFFHCRLASFRSYYHYPLLLNLNWFRLIPYRLRGRSRSSTSD